MAPLLHRVATKSDSVTQVKSDIEWTAATNQVRWYQ